MSMGSPDLAICFAKWSHGSECGKILTRPKMRENLYLWALSHGCPMTPGDGHEQTIEAYNLRDLLSSHLA